MNINNFIERNNIKQIKISNAISSNFNCNFIFGNIEIKHFLYLNQHETTIFYGMYNLNDYISFTNHKGSKFIFWGGNDADFNNPKRAYIFNNLKNVKHHLCSNKMFTII